MDSKILDLNFEPEIKMVFTSKFKWARHDVGHLLTLMGRGGGNREAFESGNEPLHKHSEVHLRMRGSDLRIMAKNIQKI